MQAISIHRSAKIKTPPNAVDFLWYCEGVFILCFLGQIVTWQLNCLTPWPTFATNRNPFLQLTIMGPPQWTEKLTDDAWRTLNNHKSYPCAHWFWSFRGNNSVDQLWVCVKHVRELNAGKYFLRFQGFSTFTSGATRDTNFSNPFYDPVTYICTS